MREFQVSGRSVFWWMERSGILQNTVGRIEQFVRHELSELEAHEIASLLATFRPWFDAYRRVLGEISD